MKDSNRKASRKALNIMIELYKKKIWNDSKTVNQIAEGCLLNEPKLVNAACQFFLSEYKEEDIAESDDEEELDELRNKYRCLVTN